MMKRLFLKSIAGVLGLIFFTVSGLSGTLAQEKLRIATPVTTSAVYLHAWAAEEKGFWRQEGLPAEWLPFRSGALFIRALAAGEFDMGMAGAALLLPPVARGGVDVLIVADLKAVQPFYFWVRTDSPIKGWKDLTGAKIGVSTLGGLPHTYGRAAIKGLGLEGKIKFVGAGGQVQIVAALKVGAVDAAVLNVFDMAGLKFGGQVREIVSIAEYLPKDYMDQVVFGRREFVGKNPEVARKIVRSALRATDFVKTNRQWSIEKLKSIFGYSEETAAEMYKLLVYSEDGKINRAGLENTLNFLVEYGIVPKEKAPPVDKLFTREFTG